MPEKLLFSRAEQLLIMPKFYVWSKFPF